MTEESNRADKISKSEIENAEWGQIRNDNFGYASDDERRERRGLEDWEMVEHMPDSQRPVPKWFWGVVAIVFLVSIGLSFPFWGNRPGYERDWINWGYGAAILYLLVFGGFVYYVVNYHTSKVDGYDDSDKKNESPEQKK